MMMLAAKVISYGVNRYKFAGTMYILESVGCSDDTKPSFVGFYFVAGVYGLAFLASTWWRHRKS